MNAVISTPDDRELSVELDSTACPACTQKYNPVCATQGTESKTFTSEECMNFENCDQGQNWKFSSFGVCEVIFSSFELVTTNCQIRTRKKRGVKMSSFSQFPTILRFPLKHQLILKFQSKSDVFL